MKFPHINSVVDFFSKVRTYFDTNAVMSSGFEKLLKGCAKQLKEDNVSVYISSSVMYELKKLSASEEEETAKIARERLAEIYALAECEVIKFAGNPNYKCPATQQLIKTAVKYRSHNALAFITCNKNLSHDLLMQNELKSFNGRHIYVFRISQRGFLFDYEESSEEVTKPESNNDQQNFLDLFGLN